MSINATIKSNISNTSLGNDLGPGKEGKSCIWTK